MSGHIFQSYLQSECDTWVQRLIEPSAIPGVLNISIIITLCRLAYRKLSRHNAPQIRLIDPVDIRGGNVRFRFRV